MNLNGSVAIVTGAVRGIGQVVAAGLAGAGAKVAMVDVLAERVERAAGESALARATSPTARHRHISCARKMRVIGILLSTHCAPERKAVLLAELEAASASVPNERQSPRCK